MKSVLERIAEVTASFDERTDAFLEVYVEAALCDLSDTCNAAGEPLPFEMAAERMAFAFVADSAERPGGWGLYFGPAISFPTEDGGRQDCPSLQDVTAPVLDYWGKRAREAKHPILRARYSDLVWELKQVAKVNCPPDLPRIMIDATVDIVEKRLYEHSIFVVPKLHRALSVARALKDSAKIEKLHDAVLGFEDLIAKDELQGTWGFSFDMLLKEKHKVRPTKDQETKIIADLEGRLCRLAAVEDVDKLDPHCVQAAALRLAPHYRRLNQATESQRVVRMLADAFLRKSTKAMALVATEWLERVYDLLLEYNLKEDADRIAIAIRDYGRLSTKEMPTMAFSVPVEVADLYRFIESMTAGDDLEAILNHLAVYFLPLQEDTEQQTLVSPPTGSFTNHFSQKIGDHEGRTVGQVGSVQEDVDGHIVRIVQQSIQLRAPFLRLIFDKLISEQRLTVESLFAYLYKSPYFDQENRPVLASGITAYFEQNWIVAIHVLVPQIERAIRKLLTDAGGSDLKQGRHGSMMLKNLDELLRDTATGTILNERQIRHLQVLLTDPRGRNIRNNVCHSLIPAAYFGPEVADWLLHSLLILGSLRKPNEESQKNDS